MCVGTTVESTWMLQLLAAPRPVQVAVEILHAAVAAGMDISTMFGGWSGLERNALVGAVNAAPPVAGERLS